MPGRYVETVSERARASSHEVGYRNDDAAAAAAGTRHLVLSRDIITIFASVGGGGGVPVTTGAGSFQRVCV